jgi:glycosyltransferase involved in cell wall biosynthesis
LKVLHVPYTFHPDPSGGVEVYVETLIQELAKQAVEGVVAAPGSREASYRWDGIAVRRHVPPPALSIEDLYDLDRHGAGRAFESILEQERPDILHLHALARGASAAAVRVARCQGIATVFTFHTPTVSCQRGMLLRWGQTPCPGLLDPATCASCALHGLGMGRLEARLTARAQPLGRLAGALGLQGGPWTALRMPQLVESRQQALRSLLAEVDQVVVVSKWASELLRRNRLAQDRVSLSRHGLREFRDSVDRSRTGSELRVAFLGRLHPAKGPDFLIRALARVPGAAIQLHLYGAFSEESSRRFQEELAELVAADSRVELRPPVANQAVRRLLAGYDLLAVPSQGFETGPLVVLEAFAAGRPVIGSSVGGIAELVSDGVDGMLVPPRSIEAWAQALDRLAQNRPLVERLRSGVKPPRSAADMAADMIAVYERALRARSLPKQ